jgi:electron transfer flavoprotein beta subunit
MHVKGEYGMHVVVCLKQVLDPEIPPRDFKIDANTNQPIQGNARMVLDSYAENALEMAIQLKENTGATVTVLTVGDKPADDGLRRGLAFTANAAVRAWDPAWGNLDGLAVAHVLGRAIKAIGGADLVLLGRQASDIEEGLVGPALAEELGAPCVTLVSSLTAADGQVKATRESDSGFHVMQVNTPAVLTITSSETNVPRLPKVKDAMLSKSKPLKVLGAAEIDADADRLAPGSRLERAFIPATDVACELMSGSEGPEKAQQLASRLQDLKVL